MDNHEKVFVKLGILAILLGGLSPFVTVQRMLLAIAILLLCIGTLGLVGILTGKTILGIGWLTALAESKGKSSREVRKRITSAL